MANEEFKDLENDERLDALMPWIWREQLEAAERQSISSELISSPGFQAKLAEEESLALALADIADDEEVAASGSADAAWLKFRQRLEAHQRDSAGDLTQARLRTPGRVRSSVWRSLRLPQTRLGWIVTSQTAALAAFAFVLVPGQFPKGNGEYRTLSADTGAQAPEGNVVIVFEPTAPEAAMREILEAVNARIVDGPMANGGYVIVVEEGKMDTTINALKANEAVLLAETLGAGSER